MQAPTISQEKAEKFVVLWQTNKVSAIVRQLGVSRQRVHAIANQLRENGVPLKGKKERPNSYAATLDIGKLKSLAETLNKAMRE